MRDYLTAMEKAVAEDKRKLRNDAIEECARVVDRYSGFSADERRIAAAAIRALKDKV